MPPYQSYHEKTFRTALQMELAAHGEDLKGLRTVAAALIAKAVTGDIQAIAEIANRLDGRPPQTITGDPNAPLEIRHIAWLGDNAVLDVTHNGHNGNHVTKNGRAQVQIGPPTKVTITTRDERKRIWAKAHMRKKRAEAKAAKLANMGRDVAADGE